jgi:hypothetical protein
MVGKGRSWILETNRGHAVEDSRRIVFALSVARSLNQRNWTFGFVVGCDAGEQKGVFPNPALCSKPAGQSWCQRRQIISLFAGAAHSEGREIHNPIP